MLPGLLWGELGALCANPSRPHPWGLQKGPGLVPANGCGPLSPEQQPPSALGEGGHSPAPSGSRGRSPRDSHPCLLESQARALLTWSQVLRRKEPRPLCSRIPALVGTVCVCSVC